jgi:hypothetical protein
VNRKEAKQLLLLYRPESAEAPDPGTAAALALLDEDADLREWFEKEREFQRALRQKLRQLPAPAALRERILADSKVVRLPPRWRHPAWLAAAAAILLLLGLAVLQLGSRAPDRFADFRSRMVGTVLREYRMDIETNSMAQVRRFLASQGTPADYQVPAGLDRLKLTGAGALRWRGHPVSMVCFDRGGGVMLFLFVMPRAAAKDPPSAAPSVAQVNKLLTASWTEGDKAYILAGPPEPDFARKYL